MVAAGALLGLAFEVKLFEALVAALPLALLWWSGRARAGARRARALGGAGACVAVGLAWLVVVTRRRARRAAAVGLRVEQRVGVERGLRLRRLGAAWPAPSVTRTRGRAVRPRRACPRRPGPAAAALRAGRQLGARLGRRARRRVAGARLLAADPRLARGWTVPAAPGWRRSPRGWRSGTVLFSAQGAPAPALPGGVRSGRRRVPRRGRDAGAGPRARVAGAARRSRPAPRWPLPRPTSVAAVARHAQDSGTVGALPPARLAALSAYLRAHQGARALRARVAGGLAGRAADRARRAPGAGAHRGRAAGRRRPRARAAGRRRAGPRRARRRPLPRRRAARRARAAGSRRTGPTSAAPPASRTPRRAATRLRRRRERRRASTRRRRTPRPPRAARRSPARPRRGLLAALGASAWLVLAAAERPSVLSPPTLRVRAPWLLGPLSGALAAAHHATSRAARRPHDRARRALRRLAGRVGRRARAAAARSSPAPSALAQLVFVARPAAAAHRHVQLHRLRPDGRARDQPVHARCRWPRPTTRRYALSNWHHLPSPYGPLFTLALGAARRCSRCPSPTGTWKAIVVGCALAALALVAWLARRLGRSPAARARLRRAVPGDARGRDRRLSQRHAGRAVRARRAVVCLRRGAAPTLGTPRRERWRSPPPG